MPMERKEEPASKPLKIVYINDDEGMRGVASALWKLRYPHAMFLTCATIPEAEEVLEKHGDVNALISDVKLKSGAYGSHGSVIKFLKEIERTRPEIHLALYSGIITDFDAKGLRLFHSPEENEKLYAFIESLERTPYREPPKPKETIDLRQWQKAVLHIDSATGKTEVVRLVKSAEESGDPKTIEEVKKELESMRQGWRSPRPKNAREAIARLTALIHSGTLSQRETNAVWKYVGALKKQQK